MDTLSQDSESTATSTIACQTPPSTITEATDLRRSSVPHPGQIYMICQRSGSGVLTLVNGNVVVVDGVNPHGAAHWACETRCGYLGFRNTASGGYLSHDGGANIITNRYFLPFEMFNISPHVDGGHILLSPYFWFAQKKVAIASDGQSLIRTDSDVTIWDFVRMDNKCL